MGKKRSERNHQAEEEHKAASGVPKEGWAVGDRFSWEEINLRLIASADEEISGRPRTLFFSGLTAGFAIVLTLIGHAVGSARFPDNAFLASLLYPVGFVYIILGRYQLYTENTLPPVKLVLNRMASVPLLLRLWVIVLIANMAGAALGTVVIAHARILSSDAMAAAVQWVKEALLLSRKDIFFRSLFAGWLVAGVIWMGTAARDTITRLIIVYFVFYMIAVCGLFHIVTVSAEIFLVCFFDHSYVELQQLVVDYGLPVLLGNTAGGVLVFTFVAYAQSERLLFPEIRVLSWKEMWFSMKGGEPFEPRELKR